MRAYGCRAPEGRYEPIVLLLNQFLAGLAPAHIGVKAIRPGNKLFHPAIGPSVREGILEPGYIRVSHIERDPNKEAAQPAKYGVEVQDQLLDCFPVHTLHALRVRIVAYWR